MPNWRMYASRDKLLRVACAASNARSCASSNWCAAVPRVLRSHCARAELVRCFPVARGMAFEGIGFSDRASSPMGDTQTAVKVSSTTVRRLLTPFTLLGRRRQRSRGLVTISSLALLLATTPGASAEAPPSPPPMLPSAVCTTPGGYCLLSSGICSSASLVITTVSECEAAAVALELSDTTATLENQRVYLPPPPPSPPPRSLSPSPPAPSPPSPPPSLPPLPPPSLPPPSPPLCWKFDEWPPSVGQISSNQDGRAHRRAAGSAGTAPDHITPSSGSGYVGRTLRPDDHAHNASFILTTPPADCVPLPCPLRPIQDLPRCGCIFEKHA